jgi:hypothetical protein
LNAFVQFDSIGSAVVSVEAAAAAAVDEELIRKLEMPITELDLTVRSSNCLEVAAIDKVAQLVSFNDRELLALRSFGRTSLREIKRKLEDLDLSLGMQLPPGVDSTVVIPPELTDGSYDDDGDDYYDSDGDESNQETTESTESTESTEPTGFMMDSYSSKEDPGDEIIGAPEESE